MTIRLRFAYRLPAVKIDIGDFHYRANDLKVGAYVLMAYFVMAKYYVWMWLLKPLLARPALTRHNLSLGLIDLGATVALVAAFFLLMIIPMYQLAFTGVTVLILYNYLLRTWRIKAEIRRLMKSSKKWKLPDARHHVRLQARLTIFQ